LFVRLISFIESEVTVAVLGERREHPRTLIEERVGDTPYRPRSDSMRLPDDEMLRRSPIAGTARDLECPRSACPEAPD
jgi:hypothetical protein